MRTSALAAALFAAAIAATACGSARRAEPLVGPFATSDPALQRGRVAYDLYCYKCHGDGEGALGPAINDKPLPRFLMRLQVRAGLGAMPSFSRADLSDRELDDIVDYLVAIRRHGR